MPVFDNSVYSFPVLSVDNLTFVQSYVNSIPATVNTDFCILTHGPDFSVSFLLQFVVKIIDLQLIMK